MRRAVGSEPMRISSVVARINPVFQPQASDHIAQLEGASITWQSDDQTKVVVLLEMDSDDATLQRLSEINNIGGVITADLCFTCED